MLEINKHKGLVSDLPIITENYAVLLEDENPIIYTGSNKYGNKILGIIIEDDDENNLLRYFHVIVDHSTYYSFINRESTLLEILKTQNLVFVVDRKYDGEIYDQNLISFTEIPSPYLPRENSYCPKIQLPFSFEYGISLKGKLADLHKAEVNEVNDLQDSFYDVLKTAMNSLNELDIKHHLYLEPAKASSYKINFSIELDSKIPTSIFSVDVINNNNDIAEYLSKYLDYIISKLPNEKVNILKEQVVDSPSFKEVENKLADLYKHAHLNTKPEAIEHKLVESINATALKFESITSQIRNSQSFNHIEVTNNTAQGEIGVGFIDQDYFEKIKPKLIIEEPIKEVFTVEEDQTETSYRILVYSLNIETGVGGAKLFYGMEERFDKVSLYIKTEDKSISGSIYSKSLDEDKVVDVKGKARKEKGKYKSLTVHI